MNRVCVVAVSSDLFRRSKSWCFMFVDGAFGVVQVCCLVSLFVCACLMASSLVVVFVVIGGFVDVVVMVVLIVLLHGVVVAFLVLGVIVVFVSLCFCFRVLVSLE